MTEPKKYISIEIRQFIEKEIKHLDEKFRLIQDKNDEALRVAQKEMERRLEGMNEFRSQLDKQSRTFITREEYLLSERLINQKIETLSKIVYIGIGIVLVLQVLLKFIIK